MKTSNCILPLTITLTIGMNVELVSIAPYGVPVAPALIYTGAALDVATEKANRRYDGTLNVSLTLLYGSLNHTCEEASSTVVDLLAHHYYQKRQNDSCIAIIGPSNDLISYLWGGSRFPY